LNAFKKENGAAWLAKVACHAPFSSVARCSMSSVKLTIHSTGNGTCSLTGKEDCDGLTLSFEDGTVQEAFLSWRGFRQLLGLTAGQKPPKESRAAVSVAAHGKAAQ